MHRPLPLLEEPTAESIRGRVVIARSALLPHRSTRRICQGRTQLEIPIRQQGGGNPNVLTFRSLWL